MKRTVVTSAVILMPPASVWPPIQAVRSKHDKAFVRWMPHVNLLYPFVPLSEFADAAGKVSAAISSLEPFEVRFDSVRHFDHGKGSTVWLSPAPVDKVKALQSALESAFPFCTDLSSRSDAGFIPHLSVGQWPSRDAERQCAALTTSTLGNISSFMCSSVELIARENDEPFAIRYSIPFGGKGIVESRVPYTAQAPTASPSRGPTQRSNLKLFVGGLDAKVTEEVLTEMFVRHGFAVNTAKVITDDSGASRGFGFVTLDSDDAMRKAVASAELFAPHAKIELAKPK